MGLPTVVICLKTIRVIRWDPQVSAATCASKKLDKPSSMSVPYALGFDMLVPDSSSWHGRRSAASARAQ